MQQAQIFFSKEGFNSQKEFILRKIGKSFDSEELIFVKKIITKVNGAIKCTKCADFTKKLVSLKAKLVNFVKKVNAKIKKVNSTLFNNVDFVLSSKVLKEIEKTKKFFNISENEAIEANLYLRLV